MREMSVASATPVMPSGGIPGIHAKIKAALRMIFKNSAVVLMMVLAFTLSILFSALRYGCVMLMARYDQPTMRRYSAPAATMLGSFV